MKETTTLSSTTYDAAKKFADSAAVPPQRLLKLIKLWRHLQAGSSHKKCKSHSTVD